MTPYRTPSPPPDARRAPPVPWYVTRAAFAFTSSISALVGAAFLALAAGNALSADPTPWLDVVFVVAAAVQELDAWRAWRKWRRGR